MWMIKQGWILYYILTLVLIFHRNGQLESNKSQGDEIVSNPSMKTPVWKLFRFPRNGKEPPSTKGKVICHLCRKNAKCLIRTILPTLCALGVAPQTRTYQVMSYYIFVKWLGPQDWDEQSAMLECLHKLQPLDKTTTRYKQLVSSSTCFYLSR